MIDNSMIDKVLFVCSILCSYLPTIVFFCIIAIAIKASSKKQNQVKKENQNIPSQTNRISEEIANEEFRIEKLDRIQDTCKYSTQDPYFSFDGKPNDFDDFAELRKKNAKHEKHLQQRLL